MMDHVIPENSSNRGDDDTPSPPVRVGPGGSSKRKSKPVKRIINVYTDVSSVADPPMQVTSDGTANSVEESLVQPIKEKSEEPSQDPIVTPEMDQSEMMRRFTEMLANGQGGLQANLMANSFQTLLAAAAAGCTFDMSNLSPSANVATEPLTGENFLQAVLSTSMGNIANSTPTTLSSQASLLQGLVGHSGNITMDHLNSSTPSPFTPLALSKGPVKRKLFDGNKDLMRQAATTITKEERIDLDDLENFAQMFKKQRIKFGFTQGDVGVALGKRYGTDFSQTTISRFEALNLSFKNMCKLRPLLKEWLADAESAIANGATLNDLLDKPAAVKATNQFDHSSATPLSVASLSVATTAAAAAALAVTNNRSIEPPSVKRRRKRTNLDMAQRTTLDAFFALNPRPDHDRMTEIANSLELERDVVRVWFCNRRQKLRRSDDPEENALITSIKAFTQNQSLVSPGAPSSDDGMQDGSVTVSMSTPSTPTADISALAAAYIEQNRLHLQQQQHHEQQSGL